MPRTDPSTEPAAVTRRAETSIHDHGPPRVVVVLLVLFVLALLLEASIAFAPAGHPAGDLRPAGTPPLPGSGLARRP